jgi:lactonase
MKEKKGERGRFTGRRFIRNSLIVLAGIIMAVAVLAGPFHAPSMAADTSWQGALPPVERDVPVVAAEPWLKLSDNEEWSLEGPAFDREGNLFLVETVFGQVFKVTPDKKVTTIIASNPKEPALIAGCGIHKDGRLILAMGLPEKTGMYGRIVAVKPDGTGSTTILESYQGKAVGFMDDVAFDKEGNIYATELAGSALDPTGRVFRISADFKHVDVVLNNLAGANGVVFAPDYSCMYVSETSGNNIYRVILTPDGLSAVPIFGVALMYRLGGVAGADSLQIDAAGNIYEALYGQGRIVILDPNGIPVEQVLVPDRGKGMHMKTSHVMLKPGTSDAYMTASGKGGAVIYKFPGLAKAPPMFSHQ